MTKIYVLKHPDTQEIRYVGKTTQELKSRLAGHISRSKKSRSAYVNCWIYNLLLQNKQPIIELIEEVENWEEREKYWIKHYHNLCNHQKGGGHGNLGVNLSENHKNNISKSLKGRLVSLETRQKISKALIGNKLSDSTKLKLSLINKGKVLSKEERFKRSKGGVYQYDKNLNLLKIYISLSEASFDTGLSKGNISSACKNRRKTCGGYIWKYNKNEDIVQSS